MWYPLPIALCRPVYPAPKTWECHCGYIAEIGKSTCPLCGQVCGLDNFAKLSKKRAAFFRKMTGCPY